MFSKISNFYTFTKIIGDGSTAKVHLIANKANQMCYAAKEVTKEYLVKDTSALVRSSDHESF